MQHLIAALEARHPGCKVVDVSFLVNPSEVANQPVEELDLALADAVMNAVEVSVQDLSH
jgi:hypothetical protein